MFFGFFVKLSYVTVEKASDCLKGWDILSQINFNQLIFDKWNYLQLLKPIYVYVTTNPNNLPTSFPSSCCLSLVRTFVNANGQKITEYIYVCK